MRAGEEIKARRFGGTRGRETVVNVCDRSVQSLEALGEVDILNWACRQKKRRRRGRPHDLASRCGYDTVHIYSIPSVTMPLPSFLPVSYHELRLLWSRYRGRDADVRRPVPKSLKKSASPYAFNAHN
jgi:hypothetical protein